PVTQCDGLCGSADPNQKENHGTHAADDPGDARTNANPESPHVERLAASRWPGGLPLCPCKHRPHNTADWRVFLGDSVASVTERRRVGFYYWAVQRRVGADMNAEYAGG